MSLENENVEPEVVDEVQSEEEVAIDDGDESSGVSPEGDVVPEEAETQEQLEEELEAAAEAGESKAQLQARVEKFLLKVNGKEKEVELDLNDKEKIKAELQKSHAFSSEREKNLQFQEAFKNFAQKLASNPFDLLKSDLGFTEEQILELAYEKLNSYKQEQEKDPAIREQEERERQFQQLMQEKQETERKLKEYELSQQVKQAESMLNSQIDQVFDDPTWIAPKNEALKAKLLDAYVWARQKPGFEKVTIKDVAPAVLADWKSELTSFAENAPDELLQQFFGKRIEKSRQERVKKAQVANSKVIPKTNTQPKAPPAKPKEKMRIDNYFEQLQKEFGSGFYEDDE